jgi:hypothetical protein
MKTIQHILFFSTLLIFASCDETPATEVDESLKMAESDEPVSDCSTAPTVWFKMVNGVRVTPAPNEGPTSVFANNATVTNCDFQRWSWQKFLWLTNETNGRPFFIDNLTQVTSIGGTIAKGGDVILTDTAQASGSTDVLRTPSGSTVYYSILVNDQLFATVKKFAPLAKKNPKSIQGVTFPVGSLEMKTSWLNAKALGADSSSYYIMNGKINGVNARVALLGIHVVGVVENHPEFIWATFEHDDLAAMYDWSGATPTTDNFPVTSPNKAYPLFAKGAQATIENITSGNGIYTDVFSLYKYGTPIQIEKKGKFDVRLYMPTSQTNGYENFNNIDGLNKSVKKQLTGVWKNYFMNGSLWINTEGYVGTPAQAALLDSLGHDLSNSNPGKLPRGSVAAYNITMETYVQAGFAPTTVHGVTVNDLVNCFFCHSASHGGNTSPLQISHFFNGYLGNLNGLTKEQVKARHVEAFRAKAILNSVKKD